MPTASRTAAILAGAVAGSLGVFERGLGVLVEELAGRNQMAGNVIRGCLVQCGEFATDFGRQLPGFDRGGQCRAGSLRLIVRVLRSGLFAPRPAGARRPWRTVAIARSAARSAGVGSPSRTSLVAAVLPVARHVCLPCFADRPARGYGAIRLFAKNGEFELVHSRIQNRPPRNCGGRFFKGCSAVSYFSTRMGSIIGAGRLSFRVRDGSGRFPAAVAAVTLFYFQP